MNVSYIYKDILSKNMGFINKSKKVFHLYTSRKIYLNILFIINNKLAGLSANRLVK